ncbi:MAG: hypothetical protein Fur0021_02370 [Candidatus Promineifilaceae bacterium]
MRNQNRTTSELILFTILFLFFMQLLVDFVGAIYSLGLLQTSVPVELVSVVLLFAPLALLALPNGLRGWPLVIVGEVMLVCRVFEVVLDGGPKMILSGIGVGCFLVLLPAILWQHGRSERQTSSLTLVLSFTLVLALLILFRAWGSGLDLTMMGGAQAVGFALAVLAGIMLMGLAAPEEPPARLRSSRQGVKMPASPPATIASTITLSIGIYSVFTLIYFAFSAPNVIARWTGASYPLIVGVVVVSLSAFTALILLRSDWLAYLTPPRVLAANLLFVLALVGTILAHQIRFPTAASAYPLQPAAVGIWAYLPLLLMLLLFPVILLDLCLFLRDLTARQPTLRALGGGFGVGSLVLLILVLAQVFTTVYDYIPVVGPFFRDKFWLVFLLAGSGILLPLLVVDRASYTLDDVAPRLALPRWTAGVIPVLGVAAILGVVATAARPAPPPAKTSLRVLTFNIQQGYSEDGRKNVAGQLELMRQVDADIIGLQESDTNRIAGSNDDIVRYLADQLDMYAYYGPPVVVGTFGIALLSRYPLQNPQTFYMYSEGEQTATIQAEIAVADQTFNVFVTHLGNSGPLVQQEAFLQRVGALPNVIAMGDFNFRPDTEQYQLTTAQLADAWLAIWPDGVEEPASSGAEVINAADRIDHIFVSSDIQVSEARYLLTTESDHPAMFVEINP